MVICQQDCAESATLANVISLFVHPRSSSHQLTNTFCSHLACYALCLKKNWPIIAKSSSSSTPTGWAACEKFMPTLEVSKKIFSATMGRCNQNCHYMHNRVIITVLTINIPIATISIFFCEKALRMKRICIHTNYVLVQTKVRQTEWK